MANHDPKSGKLARAPATCPGMTTSSEAAEIATLLRGLRLRAKAAGLGITAHLIEVASRDAESRSAARGGMHPDEAEHANSNRRARAPGALRISRPDTAQGPARTR